MNAEQKWKNRILEACIERNPAKSNALITALHFELSTELKRALGHDCGPNFHTWAVWGSRKAGVTIRQEDLESAIRNATTTAGMVGAFIGMYAGIRFRHLVGVDSKRASGAMGGALGILLGALSGRALAVWSRQRAAELILTGNQTVLRDIGEQSARFLQLLQDGAGHKGREVFFLGLRSGPTEKGGQDRLAKAFQLYLDAFDSKEIGYKREAMISGNCEIVYHEHIRLEPYIRGAMPQIIRRCATQRLMSYEVGARCFSVADEVGSVPAAKNWTNIEDRMRYVFALFRTFHDDPEVFATP